MHMPNMRHCRRSPRETGRTRSPPDRVRPLTGSGFVRMINSVKSNAIYMLMSFSTFDLSLLSFCIFISFEDYSPQISTVIL